MRRKSKYMALKGIAQAHSIKITCSTSISTKLVVSHAASLSAITDQFECFMF